MDSGACEGVSRRIHRDLHRCGCRPLRMALSRKGGTVSIYLYIAAMALTTYLIRLLPMTLFRKPIKSRFLKSFLRYVPYACLSAMTFPGILTSTGSMISGTAALVTAIFLAYRGKSLIVVAISSACAVLATQWILSLCLT